MILAVIAGLFVGARAGRIKALDRKKGEGKTMTQRVGKRARELTTAGVVRLWKWNRGRKRKASDTSRDDDDED